MKLIYSTLLAVAMLSACSKKDDPVTPQTGELIDITITGMSKQASTKVSYEPDADKSTYVFSWNALDELSVFVPTTTGNDNQRFVVATTAAASEMTGKIATWEGTKDVYAIYPYDSDGYTFDESAKTILFDNSSQVVDALSANKYSNGLMVSTVSGATATSQSEYSIPDISLKQVMSFFELDVTDIPAGEAITSVGFETGEQKFIAAANINLATGVVTAVTSSNSVTASVENHTGTTASLNFAILPVDLSNIPITLHLTTISGSESKKYTKEFTSGLNFQANNFLFNSSGALSLSDDFTAAGTGILYLADFEGGIVPEGDTWVIADETAIYKSFTGLKSALNSLNRTVSLEFPNLTAIPNEALAGGVAVTSLSFPKVAIVGNKAFYQCGTLTDVSLPVATSIGSEAFVHCDGLSNVSLPEATSIENEAFSFCDGLTDVSLPAATLIGSSAFYYCSGLTDVSLPAATSIGSSAFSICSDLTNVSLPAATSIESSAFSSCSALTDISLPVATSIGSYAFNSCLSLTNVSLPAATSIGYGAFYSCDALSTLELSTGKGVVLASMGENVFRISDAVTNEGKVTLTIGLDNVANVTDNTLTVGTTPISYTFKKIIIGGGSESSITVTASNGTGVSW